MKKEANEPESMVSKLFFTILGAFLIGGGMFWLSTVYGNIQDLKGEVVNHVERLAKVESSLSSFDGRLGRIENKIDQLIDRRNV